MRTAYIKYIDRTNVNYSLLLMLYQLAEYDKDTQTYSVINYYSFQRLADVLGVSLSTVKRFFNNYDTFNYLSIDKKNKQITLLNNFRGAKGISYVSLYKEELEYLINSKDELFIRYYLFLKVKCGIARSKGIDTTAKQFLDTIGYSTNNNQSRSKLSSYNSALVSSGFISISHFVDSNGHYRNLYKLL